MEVYREIKSYNQKEENKMGCSNCGREMCDCPPWVGNHTSQDRAGVGNLVYGGSDRERRFDSAIKAQEERQGKEDRVFMAQSVEKKDVHSLMARICEKGRRDMEYGHSWSTAMQKVVDMLVKRWGKRETKRIIKSSYLVDRVERGKVIIEVLEIIKNSSA